MAQQRRQLSAPDEVYLNSPGFESYMGAGAVFLLVFTAAFVYSIKISFEWLAWPGLFVAVVAGYLTLRWLQGREYARKLAELEAEQQRDVTAP
jgi:cobalamin biosynthesis protein CobD/CbiB